MDLDRRDFLRLSLTTGVVSIFKPPWRAGSKESTVLIDNFDRSDSYYHGNGWESLTPGYWQIKNRSLRRRLVHRGNKLSKNWRWFPWHWETHRQEPMPTKYDPSLPFGLIFRRDWLLEGSYLIQIETLVHHLPPTGHNYPNWKQYASGYSLMGIAFGSQCQHESWTVEEVRGDAYETPAWMACWRDDGRFGIYDHGTAAPSPVRSDAETKAPLLEEGDKVTIEVRVDARSANQAFVSATLKAGGEIATVTLDGVDRTAFTDGYFGLACRGLLDFEVDEVRISPNNNRPLNTPVNELHVGYALGDTLRKEDEQWHCRFVTIFRSEGENAALRIADVPIPEEGWKNVPISGTAEIITNDFRRNTAVIEAILPFDPSEKTLYYTIWKDGENVTGDPRIGTDSVGAGTGFIGKIPKSGNYVGRLPQLKAPYRLCGLSCHAIAANNPNLPNAGIYQSWWLHDQPTSQAYQYLEDYGFQVMVWEDDVWYLELIFPPPSVDDAYKVITATIAGPTTRWQMMRHWNILNPGDHDYGMDDVKGPEQIIIRQKEDLGQDPEYMQRNFQIVSHLMRGNEDPSPKDNPKRWRRWKMPAGDFSVLILDSRLWRTSQDTNIWDDQGWGNRENLYSRFDPTRTLLGEEQFSWLHEKIRTDSSSLIMLTGLNGLHTIWAGYEEDPETKHKVFAQRDRVAADYAGWVKAGADRVLELLGSRQGLVSVYGDVHSGCILKNVDHGLYESCFGPIGRFGSRPIKQPGFGPQMIDYDGRNIEVYALYHDTYKNPNLDPIKAPKYWNFLEMVFDPRGTDPSFQLKLRNLIDAPDLKARGGKGVEVWASQTGRSPKSRLPDSYSTLPNADILITTLEGVPICGMRSLPNGTLPFKTLIDVGPNTCVILTARSRSQVKADIIQTQP